MRGKGCQMVRVSPCEGISRTTIARRCFSNSLQRGEGLRADIGAVVESVAGDGDYSG